MTELKPIWMMIDMDGIHLHEENIYNDGICKLCSDKELTGSDIQISDNVARWTNPTTDKLVMNNEPLSNKQLHEIIISQSMTIDAELMRQGELMDALKRVRKLLKVGHYNQAMNILDMVTG